MSAPGSRTCWRWLASTAACSTASSPPGRASPVHRHVVVGSGSLDPRRLAAGAARRQRHECLRLLARRLLALVPGLPLPGAGLSAAGEIGAAAGRGGDGLVAGGAG